MDAILSMPVLKEFGCVMILRDNIMLLDVRSPGDLMKQLSSGQPIGTVNSLSTLQDAPRDQPVKDPIETIERLRKSQGKSYQSL